MQELCSAVANTLSCAGNGGLCYAGLNKDDPCECRQQLMGALGQLAPLPRIVCLCGSTRFMDAFHEANRRLSLAGEIVLTVEIVTYDSSSDPQRADPEQKRQLDDLHLRKIDLCDYVYVLNVGGYIGESTRREVAYAEDLDKPVVYLEAVAE
jgi:hypothetical protein